MSKKSSKHIKNKKQNNKGYKKIAFCCYIYFNSYYSNKKFK